MVGWIPQIDFDTIMHIEATGRPKPESPSAFSSPMVSLTHSLHTQRKKACRAAPPQLPRSRAGLCWAPNHHSHEGGVAEAAGGGAAGNRGNTATDRHHAHALQSESAGLVARSRVRGRSVGLLRLSLSALSLLAERSGDGITCVALKGLLTPCTPGRWTPRRTRKRERERNKNR